MKIMPDFPEIVIEKGIPMIPVSRGPDYTRKLMSQIALMDEGDSFRIPIRSMSQVTLVRGAFKKAGFESVTQVLEKPNGERPGQLRAWRGARLNGNGNGKA